MGRKKRNPEEFVAGLTEAERVWDADGVAVLRARARLPEPPDPRWGKIRAFYRLQNRAFFRYCNGELRPCAERDYKAARANSSPLPCFQADLSFTETYRAGRWWSLYTELWEDADFTFRRRWGDTWDLASGYPAPLSDFFPTRSPWKRQLLRIAAEEMERQERRGVAAYFPDWRRRLRRAFNPRAYYLTPGGVAFYFPMCALGPPREGVPCFLCPWTETAFPCGL